ncbi:MAG: flippase-like domain-containing protein, partial [Chloroflexi bacterium]|nr:flippase-like domain-containing protein [Chloroflexota bacterium]
AGLIVLPQLAGLRPVVFPLWGMTLAALVGFLVLGRKVHATPMTGRLSAVGDVLRSISTVSNSRRVTMGCLCLTATSWMSIGTAAWLVAGAAGIDLPFWLISMVIVAVNLFASVTPALPGAVGVYEFGVISTLGLFAVDPSLALTFALVFHAMLFLPPVLIAIPVLSAERRTMRQVLAVADTAIRSTRQRPRLSLPWVG